MLTARCNSADFFGQNFSRISNGNTASAILVNIGSFFVLFNLFLRMLILPPDLGDNSTTNKCVTAINGSSVEAITCNVSNRNMMLWAWGSSNVVASSASGIHPGHPTYRILFTLMLLLFIKLLS